MKPVRIICNTVAALLSILTLVLLLAPARVESTRNVVIPHADYQISADARRLHDSLVIGDLHADSTLWHRNLLQRGDRGHLDIPRLREGNVALQLFTAVTKSPRGHNVYKNSTDTLDNITLLAIAQTWPLATWSSLTARALHQGQRLTQMEQEAPEQFQIIHTAKELERLLARRSKGETIVGGLLGIEGAHALDGKLSNIDVLFDAGFRTMGLQHFFDNKLGGSLHGEEASGLTEFGRQAVDQMLAKDIIIDLAHSSTQVIKDVLEHSQKPVIFSHTGFYGHCQSHRNVSDELMQRVAKAGGLIGVGYWDGAVCGTTPKDIVASIRYGIDLLGEDHVALGSDFDGTVAIPLDASELGVLTDEMLKANFSETEIRKVMGENMMRFLRENLPAN
ncbi:MAG: dipeptidase [Motiliproteus sp.]